MSELKIPSAHNGYLMAEWHFYASGPDKTNEKKLWTTGTDAEKKLITDKIQTALADGDSDMGWSLDAGIPFAVNADTKYYNAAENTWISSMQPVFKTIFQ